MVHYCLQNGLPIKCILSQLCPVYTLVSCLRLISSEMCVIVSECHRYFVCVQGRVWHLSNICGVIGPSAMRSRYSDWRRAGRPRCRSSSPGRVKDFHFSISSRPPLRPTQPPIEWVPGALSPGVKRSGREADHWPPTSAEVKKTWVYTSTPPYAFMALCLIS
jgi:hypothetical protein